MNETPEEMSERENEAEERYRTVSADWIVYGIPDVIIVDDGSFRNGHLLLAAAMESATRVILGLHLHPAGRDAEQEEEEGKEPCL